MSKNVKSVDSKVFDDSVNIVTNISNIKNIADSNNENRNNDFNKNINDKYENYFILEANDEWTSKYKEGDIITINENDEAIIGNEKYRMKQVNVIGSDLIVDYDKENNMIRSVLGTNTKRFIIKE